MIKTIKLGNQDVKFKSTARLPAFYRMVCKGEIFLDVQKLKDPKWLENGELDTLENLAYAMAMFADPKNIISKEDWLDKFGAFDIIGALPELIDLWMGETDSTSESKKKTNE